MTDVIDPKKNPEQAAQQLVIELIRAEKTGPLMGDAAKFTSEAVLDAYKYFSNYFIKNKEN
ncbi:MAG: hypothetical protein ACL7BU_13570 [Candidatus Phlomobacter fragariae]